MNQSPPNLRLIEDSYAEKWPVATERFASIEFGPISESYHVFLPLPLALAKLSAEEQWDWLRSAEHQFEANGILATWGSVYANERSALSRRLRAAIIERVNEAVDAGLIRAPKRDPRTGAVVRPASGPINA